MCRRSEREVQKKKKRERKKERNPNYTKQLDGKRRVFFLSCYMYAIILMLLITTGWDNQTYLGHKTGLKLWIILLVTIFI